MNRIEERRNRGGGYHRPARHHKDERGTGTRLNCSEKRQGGGFKKGGGPVKNRGGGELHKNSETPAIVGGER